MVSHLPSRFKRPKAKSRGWRLEHEVNLPSECEERDLRTCFQDPCTCTVVQNSARCVPEPLQILDVSIIFEIFLSKLREGRSRLCIAWVRPDELEKQCEERWRRLVDVVVANSIQGRRTDEEFRLASLARRMLRLEARCRISRVVVLGRCVTLAQNMQRAVKIHMCWGSLAQNAERAVKSRLRDRLWSAVDCERRWRELVCLSDDARLERRLGGTWLTAHTYRRVRRAGKALPFAITVRCANVGEMTCSVYAHEKVQEVMEQALGRLAFDFQGPFTPRGAVSALKNVKHLIRNIRHPSYRSVWCCSNQGNALQVDQTLADYGVCAGATVIIHVKAHGGMQTTPAPGESPSHEDRGTSLCDVRHEDMGNDDVRRSDFGGGAMHYTSALDAGSRAGCAPTPPLLTNLAAIQEGRRPLRDALWVNTMRTEQSDLPVDLLEALQGYVDFIEQNRHALAKDVSKDKVR